MLSFRFRKKQSRSAPRPESAERRLGYAVDGRPTVRKFQFQDVFRNADHEAELAMMNPRPSAFRNFFAQFAQSRQVTAVEHRMDPSFPSASGARLTLLI
jgi:hypothetical protein